MKVIKSHIKNKLKKKVLAFLAPIVGWLLLIIVIVVVILYPTLSLMQFYEKMFGSDSSDEGSYVNMVTMMASLDETDLNNLPLDQEIIDMIVEAENTTYYRDVTINAPYKEVKKSYSDEGKLKSVKKNYRNYEYTLGYYDITYQHRVPWQLVYALSAMGAMKGNEYDDLTGEDGNLLVSKKMVKKIINILSPEFDMCIEPDDLYSLGDNYEFKNKEDLQKLCDIPLYSTVVSSGSRRRGRTRTSYYYKTDALAHSIKSYYQEITYDYEVRTNAQYKEGSDMDAEDKVYAKLKSVDTKVNTSKVEEALAYIGCSPDEVGYLAMILENLPGGEAIKLRLDLLFYEISGYSYSGFNPSIPNIEGAWSRQDLIRTAESLLGLHYFFGAKWLNYGANPDWGKLRTQTISASVWYGTKLPNGLDCSGYIDWVYFQMTGTQVSAGVQDRGTKNLWLNSYEVGADELRPGDLGFYKYGGGVHVGIYWGKIDGEHAFIHCGGSDWGDTEHPAGQCILSILGKSYKGYPGCNFKYFRRLPITFTDDHIYDDQE